MRDLKIGGTVKQFVEGLTGFEHVFLFIEDGVVSNVYIDDEIKEHIEPIILGRKVKNWTMKHNSSNKTARIVVYI